MATIIDAGVAYLIVLLCLWALVWLLKRSTWTGAIGRRKDKE